MRKLLYCGLFLVGIHDAFGTMQCDISEDIQRRAHTAKRILSAMNPHFKVLIEKNEQQPKGGYKGIMSPLKRLCGTVNSDSRTDAILGKMIYHIRMGHRKKAMAWFIKLKSYLSRRDSSFITTRAMRHDRLVEKLANETPQGRQISDIKNLAEVCCKKIHR